LYNVYDCLYAAVANDKDAIVLDFFGGSGTTAHAVLALNKEDGGKRKFILCEQMHYVESVTVPRVKKVIEKDGQGSFVYAELHKANEFFMEQIQAATSAEELKAVWLAMQENAFLSYRVDQKAVNLDSKSFDALSEKQQRQFLVEALDKNMLYVPLTEMHDEQFAIDKASKELNAQFFGEA
jgi:adenine-specific DNA-methyltransferase